MNFSQSTELYDLLYGWKDYAAETAKLLELIDHERPGAKSILDVACGTGEHARHLLAARDLELTGIDVQPEFVAAARAKVPHARFDVGDMTTLDLGRQFDVVTCLFSSIGYLTSTTAMINALSRFRAHLAPGGVILIEPWFTPQTWYLGRPHMTTAERDDLKVCRMSLAGVDGHISTLDFHYLIATPSGVEHRQERHELGLFTVEQMLDCFDKAGLTARYDEAGLMGRGLYIAHAANRPPTGVDGL